MIDTQGAHNLLALVAELEETAPHLLEFYDCKKSAKLMLRAAAAIERLAPFDPEIEVELGEN